MNQHTSSELGMQTLGPQFLDQAVASSFAWSKVYSEESRTVGK